MVLTEPENLDVFVSYSRSDSAFVHDLHTFLTAEGRNVWVDWQDIPPASEWERDIHDSIDAAASLVFVVSPASLASEYCAEELRRAQEGGKRIIPLAIDGAVPEEAPADLRRLNWIWCRKGDDRDAALAALTSALDTDLEWSKSHRDLLVQAREWERRGDGSRLLRGTSLAEAEHAVAENAAKDPRPTELQQRYLHASRRAATRRQRTLLGSISVALLVAIGLAVAALLQRNTAISERNSARSLALSTAAGAQSDSRLGVGLLLGLEAMRVRASVQARSTMVSLLEKADTSSTRAIVPVASPVDRVAFSPHGHLLAVLGGDGSVRMWDLRTRREIGRPPGHRAVSIAFSPDGGTLAVAEGKAHSVRLWSVRGPQRVPEPLPAGGEALSVAFSPDGKKLAAGAGGAVQLWTVRTRERAAPLAVPDQVTVSELRFSGRGHRLAALGGLTDDVVLVWNLRTDGPPKQIPNSSGLILGQGFAFSPDGGTLALANASRGVLLRSARTGRPVGARTIGRGRLQIVDVAFGPKGRNLVTAGEDGAVRLWDVRTGRQLAVLSGHHGGVFGVEYSPDGHTVASGGRDMTARLWDVRKPAPLWSGEQDAHAVAFRGDGRVLVGASRDRARRVWVVNGDGRPGSPHPARIPYGGIDDIALGADGTRAVAIGGYGQVLELWDVRKGTGPRPFRSPGGRLNAAAISPGGTLIAAGGDRGEAWIWNAATRKRRVLQAKSASGISSAAFGPGGTLLATGEGDIIRLWKTASGHQLLPPFAAHMGLVNGLAFSSDGTRIVSVSDDGTARIWDVRKHREVGIPIGGGLDNVASAALSPDGRILVTADEPAPPSKVRSTVRLWDVATDAPIGRPLSVSKGDPDEVAISPDGRSVAAVTSDGRVDVWHGVLWRDPADLRARVCDLVWGNLTKAEWAAYAPGLPAHATCG